MFPSDLQFTWPKALEWILVVFPLLLLWFAYQLYKKRCLSQFAESKILPKISKPRSLKYERMRLAALLLCWILACITLAGPYGNIRYRNIEKTVTTEVIAARPLIFIVDASASMGVEDLEHRSRLQSSKEIILDMLPNLAGHPLGLYALTTELVQLSPVTYDDLFFKIALKALQINEGGSEGTDIAAALSKLSYPENSLILLFSDGGEKELKRTKLPLIAVAVGSEAGGVIPHVEFNGKAVSSKLEARYLEQLTPDVYSTSNTPLRKMSGKLVETINSENERKLQKSITVKLKPEDSIKDLYFQIPLGLAALMLGAFLFFTDRVKTKALILVISLMGLSLNAASTPLELYNIGTEDLKYDRIDQAVESFRQVRLLEAPSPRFVVYDLINTALANIRTAINPLNDQAYANYLLEETSKIMGEAEKMDCLWLSCVNSAKITEIKEAVQSSKNREPILPSIQGLKITEPKAILIQAILDGHEAIQDNLLNRDESSQKQNEVLKKVRAFVSSVLPLENREYHHYHCQITLWQQVMPLIQNGYEDAIMASDLIALKRNQEALWYQNRSVVNWKKALIILENPPKNDNVEDEDVAKQTIHNLEEMYLEDAPPKMPLPKTFHAW